MLECSPSELSLVEKAEEFKFPTFLEFVVYSRGFKGGLYETKEQSVQEIRSEPVLQRHAIKMAPGLLSHRPVSRVTQVLFRYLSGLMAVIDNEGAFFFVIR